MTNGSRFSLDCADCYIAGKFQINGHLSVHHFKLKSFTIDGSPQGLNAKLLLDAKVTGSGSIPFSKELFSFPIPDAGISISKIFKLGLVASYDIGGSVTFASSASVSLGLKASVPDISKLTVDVQNPGSSSATGFDGGSVDPIFDLDAFSSSLTVAAYSQPKLSFGIDIIEVAHLDIALPLKLPEVDATLKAAYSKYLRKKIRLHIL